MTFGFPAQADTVLLSCDFDTGAAITEFAAKHRLTGSENRLLTAFAKTSDVSLAAASLGITTGTARQYLKSIYTKFGHKSQPELMRALFFNPAVFLARRAPADTLPVRRMLTVDGGRQLEYFSIGPEDGYPVFFFDALAGNSIDSLGHPDRYRPTLNRLGMRLITPCRPGGFRSDFRPLGSLRDYATDVTAICDHIGKHKISLLSYSYGSNAALGVAHALPDMVERVTVASVSYTNYVNADWRNRDMFFQVTNVIGRRWPALLKRLIPFLARSVIQNVHPFAERMLANAQCDHERMILGDHRIRARTSAMVAERTANGFDGVIEEYRLNAQPYDFDVREITASMTLFHGECDVHNPLMGAKMLAQDAPNATLHVLPDMGHHLLFKEWDWIFAAAMNVDFEMPTKTPLQFA